MTEAPVHHYAVYVHYHPPFPRDRDGRPVTATSKMIAASRAGAVAKRVANWPLVDHVIVDPGTGDTRYYTRGRQAS